MSKIFVKILVYFLFMAIGVSIVDSFLKEMMISFGANIVIPAGVAVGFCAARLFYETLDFFYDSFFKQKAENLKKYKKDVEYFVFGLKKELSDELLAVSKSIDMNIDSAECCVFGKRITEKSLTEKIFNTNILKNFFLDSDGKEENKYIKKMFKTYAKYINEYYSVEFKKRLKANDATINRIISYFENKCKKIFDYSVDREMIDSIKSEEIDRCNLECEKERDDLKKNIEKNIQLKDFLISDVNENIAKIVYNMLHRSPIKCIDIYWKGDNGEYMKDKSNKKDINSFHFGNTVKKSFLNKKKEDANFFDKIKNFFSKTDKKDSLDINKKHINCDMNFYEDDSNPSCDICQSTSLSINENGTQQDIFI